MQPFGIKLGRRLVGLQQPAALALLLARDVTALLVPELDAGPGREPLDRLREREVVDLLHELDHVTAVGAGEAVPQAGGGGDVEGGRPLVGGRAQPLERAAAGVGEREVLADPPVDRRALADAREVLVAVPPCHSRPPPPEPALPVPASLVLGTPSLARF